MFLFYTPLGILENQTFPGVVVFFFWGGGGGGMKWEHWPLMG